MEDNKEQKIWVTISETIKTGEYENIKIEAGFSRIYGSESDPIKLIKKEMDELEVILKKKAKTIRKKREE